MKGNIGIQRAGGGGKNPRKEADFYPTPPDITTAMLRKLKQWRPNALIVDPACGDGAICEVANAEGFNSWGSDLHDYGWKPMGAQESFLTIEMEWPKHTVLVTNPPFKLAEEFIFRAAELDRPFFFMLKAQYFHGGRRTARIDKAGLLPNLKFPCTWRASFDMSGRGGPMDVTWFGWDKSYQHPNGQAMEPLYRPKGVVTNRLEALL